MCMRSPWVAAASRRAVVLVAWVWVAVAVAGGCRRSGPAVEMVEGVVTLDGKPVEGVVVAFKPLDGAGLMAFGTSQADGRFWLNATRGGRPGKGTVAGDYAVTFTKTTGGYEIIEGPAPQPPDAPPPDIEAEKAAYEKWARERAARKPRPLPPVEYLVPRAYIDEKTSGFRVTVKKGRNAGPEFRFDLRSDFEPTPAK